jgi:oligopeptide/dipeptide ABC transporter ATP-binding protein
LTPLKEGTVEFGGSDVSGLTGRASKAFRSEAQMVFQDPFESLNPRMPVGKAIEEVLQAHGRAARPERRRQAAQLFKDVGLDPAYLGRYPHEFSGGQRQRIGIARALAVDPRLVIADEPVSALDVSVQVQILNLLKDLQAERGLSYLFVAHDLAVVRYMCARLYVMYLGRVVETGPSQEVYAAPGHPYTEALLSAVPDVERGLRRDPAEGRIILEGDVPSARQVIPGCPFHPRCPRAQARCRTEVPPLRNIAEGRCAACHFADEVLAHPLVGERSAETGS